MSFLGNKERLSLNKLNFFLFFALVKNITSNACKCNNSSSFIEEKTYVEILIFRLLNNIFIRFGVGAPGNTNFLLTLFFSLKSIQEISF